MKNTLLLFCMMVLLALSGCKKNTNPVDSSTPNAPTLIAPVNQAANVIRKPIFRWSQCEGAASYRLQVSAQHDFSNMILDHSEVTSSYKMGIILQPNTLYYWRVNAAGGKNSSAWSEVFQFTTGEDTVIQLNLNWIHVEGASFLMGSEKGDPDEKPVHTVSLNNFSMSKYEVTYEQYDLFCDATGRAFPSDNGWGRGNKPVTNITWNDADEFCKWASIQTGKIIRLPTEAEWEFAARGGKVSSGFLYSGGDSLNEVSWNFGNSVGQTHNAGTKKGNELGIFDMSGNVWEWCSDWFDENYFTVSSSSNPKGPSTGTVKVIRGGSWASFTVPHGEGDIVVNGCRVSDRGSSNPSVKGPDFGFRCVMEE